LFVISTTVGGTPHTNEDLMTALDERLECFVLRSDARTLSISRWCDGRYAVLETARLARPIRAFPHASREYDEIVAGWLARFDIELVHIRHLAWHGIDLPRIAKARGVPVVFSFHDYYTVCPTVRLLDETGRFCGGDCTHTPGDCKIELWRGRAPRLKHEAVHGWRAMMAGALENCDAFVTTAESSRDLIRRFFPVTTKRPFAIIPHGRDFDAFGRLGRFPEPGGPVRVLAPGNVSTSKGARIIGAIQRLSADGRFEFHVMGRCSRGLRGVRNVVLHGEYGRAEFLNVARRISPHFGVVLSIWPETWCHTLTEMWAAGLPVLGFDLGAVGDRIRSTGAGWVLRDMSAEGTLAALQGIAADADGFARRLAAVEAWQQGQGRQNTARRMALAYVDVYRQVTPGLDRGLAKSPSIRAETCVHG
jgi:glycosyltransferase involved in cell wall biosynthesis